MLTELWPDFYEIWRKVDFGREKRSLNFESDPEHDRHMADIVSLPLMRLMGFAQQWDNCARLRRGCTGTMINICNYFTYSSRT